LKRYSKNRKNSGQVLIIASLIVVLLLLSTVVYVREIEKNAPIFSADGNADVTGIKQATFHTAISALANISNGGSTDVLTEDLSQLKMAIERSAYNAISEISFAPADIDNYSNGTWIYVGEDGEGLSSLGFNVIFNSSGNTASCYSQYFVNVTSAIQLNGTCTKVNESTSQINMSIALTNEGKPALARNLTFYYTQDTVSNWNLALMPQIEDFGNGTYTASFFASNINQNDPLTIGASAIDTREVSIWANATYIQG
jgi:hypothetical protein